MTARTRFLCSLALALAAIEPRSAAAAGEQSPPKSLDARLRAIQRILAEDPWDGEPSDDLKRAAGGVWKAGPPR